MQYCTVNPATCDVSCCPREKTDVSQCIANLPFYTLLICNRECELYCTVQCTVRIGHVLYSTCIVPALPQFIPYTNLKTPSLVRLITFLALSLSCPIPFPSNSGPFPVSFRYRPVQFRSLSCPIPVPFLSNSGTVLSPSGTVLSVSRPCPHPYEFPVPLSPSPSHMQSRPRLRLYPIPSLFFP